MDSKLNFIQTWIDASLKLNQLVYDQLMWLVGTFLIALPVFLLVLVITLICGERITSWGRFALWSIVLIRMILPVSIQSEASLQNLTLLAINSDSLSTGVGETWLRNLVDDSNSKPPAYGSLDDDDPPVMEQTWRRTFLAGTGRAVTTLIIMGMFVMAGISVLAFFRLLSWLRISSECNDAYCIEEAEIARRCLGIGARVQLRLLHQLNCPAVFDWFRPLILLPESILHQPPEEVRQIIWYQMTRIRRADSTTSLIHAAAGVLQWWNPLFWWASRQWKTERDLACAELLLSRLGHGPAFNRLRCTHTNRSRPNLLLTQAPGFVLSRHSPSLERRLMTRLSSGLLPETRCRHWATWCIVASIALTGLTDATRVSPSERPIQLPARATWHDSDVISTPSEERVVRTYNLAPYLTEIGLAAENNSVELAGIALILNSILTQSSSIDPITWLYETGTDHHDRESPSTGFKIPEVHPDDPCQVNGPELVLKAKPSEHEFFARLIESWIDRGRTQITIEFRTVSTQLEPWQLLPAAGAKIFNSKPLVRTSRISHSVEIAEPLQTSASSSIQASLPLLTCELEPVQSQNLITRCQRDERTSLIFVPKVTMFSFGVLDVRNEQVRSFATGMKTQNGTKSRNEAWREGECIQCFAYTEGGKIHLRIRYEISSINDVRIRKFRQGTDSTLEIPQRHATVLETTAIMEDGNTLIMIPLERNPDGNMSVVLITPRIVEFKATVPDDAETGP
ncbi:M56 family metallopeptidase [Schlesneria sp. DSM 10557]|uniref:M56 family metallopeptidase n=1 Tax=Schlesneria sp. DSM 10557 TaxID=3044399 RepID=UPI0035A0E31E